MATTDKRNLLWEQAVTLFTFLTNDKTALAVTILDATGTPITSFGGSGGTSSNFGSAFPAAGTAVGAIDGSGNMAGLNLDGSGNLKIAGSFSSSPTKNATASITRVADSASSVTLLSSNVNRQDGLIVNESTSAVFVKFGATASATSYVKKLLPNDTWNFFEETHWVGRIDAIWVTAPGGAAQITELSA